MKSIFKDKLYCEDSGTICSNLILSLVPDVNSSCAKFTQDLKFIHDLKFKKCPECLKAYKNLYPELYIYERKNNNVIY